MSFSILRIHDESFTVEYLKHEGVATNKLIFSHIILVRIANSIQEFVTHFRKKPFPNSGTNCTISDVFRLGQKVTLFICLWTMLLAVDHENFTRAMLTAEGSELNNISIYTLTATVLSLWRVMLSSVYVTPQT